MLILAFFLLVFSQHAFASVDQGIVDHLKKNTRTAIVTSSFEGFAIDPTTSVSSRNVFINGLYFERPLRYTLGGEITSRVLKSFRAGKGQVVFELGDYQFSDGSKIMPVDIVTTVKRALLFAPMFPVNKLKGYKIWSKSSNPLKADMDGIKVSGSKITFTFDVELENYFSWATDIIFGITKSTHINTKTGSLISQPPASGTFKLKKAAFPIVIMSGKYDLSIVYININDFPNYLKYFKSNHLVFTDSGYILPDTYKRIINTKNIVEFRQYNNRFSALLLNRNKPPFDDRRTRQFFAKEFRKSVKSSGFEPQGSLMTKLNFGFVPLAKLQSRVKDFSKEEEKLIIAKLKRAPPIPTLRTYDTCSLFLKTTAERLGLPMLGKREESAANMSCIFSGFDMIHPSAELAGFLNMGRFQLVDNFSNNKELVNLVAKMKSNNPKSFEEVNGYLF